MKTGNQQPSVLMGLILLSFFMLTAFQLPNPADSYRFSEGLSSVEIKGTSNLHDWASKVTDFEGEVMLSNSENGKPDISSCELRLQVASIKSHRGSSIMDKKTVKALEGENFPEILFSLSDWQLLHHHGSHFRGLVKGNLTITDQTNLIQFEATGFFQDDGRLEVSGSYTLLMSDYGIDAPTALMGTLKTGDEVTIDFQVKSDNSSVSN